VGHIPHGFYEEEMSKYFSQFGTVSRLRLARSKKVGTQLWLADMCLLVNLYSHRVGDPKGTPSLSLSVTRWPRLQQRQ